MATQKQPKTVSDVLAGALQLFGKKGEHWNNYTLHDVHYTDEGQHSHETFCSIGAIGHVAGYGNSLGADAKRLIKDSIPSRKHKYDSGIASWNDSHPMNGNGFRSVKAVFCKALKTAIAAEKPKRRVKRKVAKAKVRRTRG